MRWMLIAGVLTVAVSGIAAAQDERRLFVGAVTGVSTLSADGRAEISTSDAVLSLYKPENGPALNAFAGFHLTNYFSVQANYLWNRNELALVSASAASQGGTFYEQHRASHQHAFDVDFLIYFRALRSGVRPYLGTGLEILRFSSATILGATSNGLTPPAGAIASTHVALRSAVGIDFAVTRAISVRYSFSETIGGNPISPFLTPPGKRGLANFQNLFGVLGRF